MQDDDKQPSYERLDETSPERNRRSFFDWLRGKEVTEEERLRKKLDEELKEAARKRATEFEEERRTEEEREVAETRKLKKRWRAKLVEKSKKLLESTAERGDEPTNGYEIAKLMVAERIVKLHDLLTTEDLRRSEVKALKIHLDFMGLLSEKLDRPELEVPEEIEQLYQTITASVEETTGETPPTPKNPEETEPEAAPISEEDAAYTAFAASIVQAIRRALRPEQIEPLATGDGGTEPTETRPGTSSSAPERRAEQPRPADRSPLTEQLLSIVKGTALSGEAIRKEISHTEQARQLADVVEKAAIIDRFVVREAKKSPAPEPAKPKEESTTSGFDLAPNKKIKYMSDIELVSLARTIEIGGGRLLSDVYTKGELDREGLVKVLEKYRKGLDYRSEFTLRREKYRRHKEVSPEYLAEPTSQTPQSATVAQHPARERHEQKDKRSKIFGRHIISTVLPPASKGRLRDIKPSNPATPASISSDTLESSGLIRDVEERLKRQAQIALLLASVLLVVVLFVVVIELNTR